MNRGIGEQAGASFEEISAAAEQAKEKRELYARLDKEISESYLTALMNEDLDNPSRIFALIAGYLNIDKNELVKYIEYKKEQIAIKSEASNENDEETINDEKTSDNDQKPLSKAERLEQIKKEKKELFDEMSAIKAEVDAMDAKLKELYAKKGIDYIPSEKLVLPNQNEVKSEKIKTEQKEDGPKEYPELSPEDAKLIFDIQSSGEESNEILKAMANKYKVEKSIFYEMYKANKLIKNDDSNTVIDGKFINSLEKNVLKTRPSGKPTAGSPKGGLKGATLGKKRVTLIKNEPNLLKTLSNPIEKETFKERVLNHIKAWGASFKNRVFPAFNTTKFTNDEDNETMNKLMSGITEEELAAKVNVK